MSNDRILAAIAGLKADIEVAKASTRLHPTQKRQVIEVYTETIKIMEAWLTRG